MCYPGVSSLNPFDDWRARRGFAPVLARFVFLGKEKSLGAGWEPEAMIGALVLYPWSPWSWGSRTQGCGPRTQGTRSGQVQGGRLTHGTGISPQRPVRRQVPARRAFPYGFHVWDKPGAVACEIVAPSRCSGWVRCGGGREDGRMTARGHSIIAWQGTWR